MEPIPVRLTAAIAPPSIHIPAGIRLTEIDIKALGEKLGREAAVVASSVETESTLLRHYTVEELKTFILYLRGAYRCRIPRSGRKAVIVSKLYAWLTGSSTSRTTSRTSRSARQKRSRPPAIRASTSPLEPRTKVLRVASPRAFNSGSPFVYFEDFKQSQDPFTSVQRIVAVHSFRTNRPANSNTSSFSFALTPNEWTLLLDSGPNNYGLLLRFWNTSTSNTVRSRGLVPNFVRCGSIVLTPTGTTRTPKYLSKPANVYPYYNCIQILRNHPKHTPIPISFRIALTIGVAVVQLVKMKNNEQLLEEVPRKKMESRKSEDGIEEVNAKLSLRCPLGYVRMETPTRGINCKHMRCFDFNTYLNYSRQQGVWNCPVCLEPLLVQDLVVDTYQSEILKTLDDEVTEVVLDPDGTYRAPDTTIKTRRIANTTKEETVQEIDVDEIEDSIFIPPLSRKCGYCGKSEQDFGQPFKRCSACQKEYYCGVECQKAHWHIHKPSCSSSAAQDKPSPNDDDNADHSNTSINPSTTPASLAPTPPSASNTLPLSFNPYLSLRRTPADIIILD